MENSISKGIEAIRKKDEKAFYEFNAALQYGTAKKGEILCDVGDVAKKMYILQSGIVKHFRYKKDGSEHVVWFCFENDLVVAHTSFATQAPSHEGIIVLEDCTYVAIERNTCYGLALKHHAVETFFRESLEYYYLAVDERQFVLQALTAKEKYNYLLEKFPHFLQRLPQKEISSFLGITRETLSRIRRQK